MNLRHVVLFVSPHRYRVVSIHLRRDEPILCHTYMVAHISRFIFIVVQPHLLDNRVDEGTSVSFIINGIV